MYSLNKSNMIKLVSDFGEDESKISYGYIGFGKVMFVGCFQAYDFFVLLINK